MPATHPPLVPVGSSNLRAVGYDRPSATLFVAFRGGAPYAYRDVPRPVYEGLLAADSKGSYFHRMVRSAPYEWVKLDLVLDEEAA